MESKRSQKLPALEDRDPHASSGILKKNRLYLKEGKIRKASQFLKSKYNFDLVSPSQPPPSSCQECLSLLLTQNMLTLTSTAISIQNAAKLKVESLSKSKVLLVSDHILQTQGEFFDRMVKELHKIFELW
jgi:hypothetical protein